MNQWLFETLVRHAPMGIAFVDLEFRFRFVNAAVAAINGLPPEQHIGRRVQDVIPEVWPQLEPIYRRVLDTGNSVTDVEISGQVASTPSETRHWLTAFYPVRGADDALVGIGAMTMEVTEQKLVEANYRAVLAAIPDLLFEIAGDGTHLNFHAPREEALFADPGRILGRGLRELLPAAVAELYERNIAATLRERRNAALRVLARLSRQPSGPLTRAWCRRVLTKCWSWCATSPPGSGRSASARCWKGSCARRRRWRRSASSPAASRTTSTTC